MHGLAITLIAFLFVATVAIGLLCVAYLRICHRS